MPYCRNCGGEVAGGGDFYVHRGKAGRGMAAAAAVSRSASKAARVNEEWNALAPADWGSKKHAKEQAMLEGLLEDDEHLGCLASGGFAPDGGWLHNEWSHTNLVVATDRRLLFLRQRRHSDEVVSLPYYSIAAISFDTGWAGGVIKVAARRKGGYHRGGYHVGNIQPKERAKLFAETAQSLIAAAPEVMPIALSKEERIDEEWDALIPKGWGTFGDKSMNSGEHEMLYSLLEDDETLECLVGGKFGPDLGRSHVARDRSRHSGVGRCCRLCRPGVWDKSLHRGVGVATDRRVIFLEDGFLSAEAAELPYSSIETISYSVGPAMGGLRIDAQGANSFQMEMINPKEQAKVFADAVRKHLNAGQAAGVTGAQRASAMDELEKAAALYERGLLTQGEFEAKKAQLLNS